MKKIVFSIFIIITFIINCTQITYADTAIGNKEQEILKISKSSFVQEAFGATKNFFNEKVEDEDGRVSEIFDFIKKIIKAVNRILLVVLAGLSMISLSAIGIKYIMSSSMAGRMTEAKKDLKTVIIGMAIGFGAYTIWMIGISIIEIVIGSLS